MFSSPATSRKSPIVDEYREIINVHGLEHAITTFMFERGFSLPFSAGSLMVDLGIISRMEFANFLKTENDRMAKEKRVIRAVASDDPNSDPETSWNFAPMDLEEKEDNA